MILKTVPNSRDPDYDEDDCQDDADYRELMILAQTQIKIFMELLFPLF